MIDDDIIIELCSSIVQHNVFDTDIIARRSLLKAEAKSVGMQKWSETKEGRERQFSLYLDFGG